MQCCIWEKRVCILAHLDDRALVVTSKEQAAEKLMSVLGFSVNFQESLLSLSQQFSSLGLQICSVSTHMHFPDYFTVTGHDGFYVVPLRLLQIQAFQCCTPEEAHDNAFLHVGLLPQGLQGKYPLPSVLFHKRTKHTPGIGIGGLLYRSVRTKMYSHFSPLLLIFF